MEDSLVQDLRVLNRNAVLTALLRLRPASRKQIADSTGISTATVSRAVEQLIAEGLVREGSEVIVEARGRRPISLDIVAEKQLVLGIDLGASSTRVILADLVGTPLSVVVVPTPEKGNGRDLSDWLAGVARTTAGSAWSRVSSISVGLPGAVSRVARTVSNAPNLAQIEDSGFLSDLESALERPVLVDNDANLALLGEQRFGAARHTPTAAMLTLGTGLGAALSIDGRIIHGRHGLVGEFGQLPVGPLGTRLEHMVTGPGIMGRAAEAGVALSSPADLFSGDISPSIASMRGSFDQALLIVLTAVAVSCEPEVIVLGGGISHSLISNTKHYEVALKENLREAPALVAAELGDFSGAVGAVVSSLHSLYAELGVEKDSFMALPSAQTLTLASIDAC